jgi:hypothetical protein
MKGMLAFHDGLYYHLGDFRPSQIKRAGAGVIEQTIHGYKRLPGAQRAWWKIAVRG